MGIHRGGEHVGHVTSGCLSPTLDKVIAMGYVPTELSAEGTEFEIDLGKARTAAAFRRPSQALETMIPNRPAFMSVSEEYVLMEGGVPIVVDGVTLGAVGVSGVQASQDAQIAAAGVAGLQQ